jgi:hypothetical protein
VNHQARPSNELVKQPVALKAVSFQARAKATQPVGPLMVQAEGRQQAVVDRLHDLADASLPAPQRRALGSASCCSSSAIRRVDSSD